MSKNIRGKKTQAEILDAAWDLVSKQGADAKVSEIARAAGISRQAVYVHFGSRGGLLMALVKRADERFQISEAFDDALALQDPRARLAGVLSAWLAFVPRIYPVAKDLIRLRDTDPESAAAWADRMHELRQRLLTLTTSLRKDGALNRAWTPEKASHFFWAQTSVQAWGLLRFECGWTEKDITRQLERSLVNTLLSD